MKIPIGVLAIAFLLFSIPSVFADSVDPKIVIGRGVGSDPVGLTFDFTANGNGGGYFEFFNDSGADWDAITIVAPMTTEGLIFEALSVDLFSDFEVTTELDRATIRFFGVDTASPGCGLLPCYPGIPAMDHFFISLNDNLEDYDHPDGSGGWFQSPDGEPVSFAAAAHPVPEPGTLILLLGGGILVLGARFVRGNRPAKNLN
jgi:hypothetical protein